MADTKAGGYISKIKFNIGEELEINKNDIVVFVGPNNAGKSQALKDIFQLSSKTQPGIVVADTTVTKYTAPVLPLLVKIATVNSQSNSINCQFLERSMSFPGDIERFFADVPALGNFRDIFVAYLDTSARLTICWPPQSIRRDAVRTHPIHYAAYDPQYRKWLSDNFKKAFNSEVIPHTQFGAAVPLCIGEPVNFEDKGFEDEQARQEAYAAILDTYKQIQDQGDGIKSFTGILLYLMLDHYCTYIIDEPESFLHPPQARIMGQIIGKTLSNDQQAFISTHSEDIIQGLLETHQNRIKIIRITREDDINKFSILDNKKISEVWGDPLFKYSNILSSLFYKSVVLCESDSDCKMYSIIDSHIKQLMGKYSETLFIHCGGKHRMAKIVSALRALNIDVKLIPDIDVMNNECVFREIVEAFNIEWDTIKSAYKVMTSNIISSKEPVSRNTAREKILKLLDESHEASLSKKEIEAIRRIAKYHSKWDDIKKSGKSAIPSGDSTNSFKEIDRILRENGIYIVPVGELECFIKEVGGHGPEWVNAVLEQYKNLNDGVYTQITQFIRDMNL